MKGVKLNYYQYHEYAYKVKTMISSENIKTKF